ncbi:MAG: GAF domain-containing protein [Pseudomonadota bacterium]
MSTQRVEPVPKRAIRESRIPIRFAVELQTHGAVLSCSTQNVSKTGMSLLCKHRDASMLHKNQEVILKANLPFSKQKFMTVGQIVWKSSDHNNHKGEQSIGIGIKLIFSDDLSQNTYEQWVSQCRSTVLLVSMDASRKAAICRLLESQFSVYSVDTTKMALAFLDENDVAVMVCGEKVEADKCINFLNTVVEAFPNINVSTVVLAAGPDYALFQEFINSDKIFYLTSKPIQTNELFEVICGAQQHFLTKSSKQDAGDKYRQDNILVKGQKLLQVSRQLALQQGSKEAGKIVLDTIQELVETPRSYYLIYDAKEEILWSWEENGSKWDVSAAAGLAGFVARSGKSVLVQDSSQDPRFDREADDPQGNGTVRIIAEPVLNNAGRVLAIFLGVRSVEDPLFSQDDLETLQMIAEQLSAVFNQLVLRDSVEKAAFGQTKRRNQKESVFREEAIEAYCSERIEGSVLDISPTWTRWAFYLLLGVCVFGLFFIIFAHTYEYATGPAVIRVTGRNDITATATGVVTAIVVKPGDRVNEGAILVKLDSSQENADFQRLQKEFKLLLIASLRTPEDQEIARTLGGLRVQRDLAQAKLALREIKAPNSGSISDVRVRVGQNLAPGEIILGIVDKEPTFSILAFIPGHFRPQIQKGMDIRFEVAGYKHAYQKLKIDFVSDEAIGPNEAKRFLGPDATDSIIPNGPVVVLQANIQTETFHADSKDYQYYDGMLGTAEVKVRAEPIVLTLIPALRMLTEGSDG